MKIYNGCCDTDSLTLIKELYHSNVDDFNLYQCPECKGHWLHRKIEHNWVDNMRFNENDWEAWYVKIEDQDLPNVMEGQFDEVLFNGTYLYLSTEHKIPNLKIIE